MTNTLNKDIMLAGISEEWKKILNVPLLDDVITSIGDCKNIVPPQDKIFEFARLTSLNNIKIIILGQDPYPKAGDAHGLAFSCLTNIPGSLRNIYKCLIKNNLLDKMPNTGDLTQWAKQGVLLLNCALTTIVGHAGYHLNYWESYTNYLINKLSKRKIKIVVKSDKSDSQLDSKSDDKSDNKLDSKSDDKQNNKNKVYIFRPIFMLWGNFAKNKSDVIYEKCKKLEYSHPSPLAQSRASFIECKHFNIANKIIIKHKLDPIDWNPEEERSDIEKAFDLTDYSTVVFTDGSCYPNRTCPESKAGYAACFVLGLFTDTILYGNIQNRPHYATNIRAEGTAIYKALLFLDKHSEKWDSVIFVSDSEFWIKMFNEFIPKWEQSGDNLEEKKNADLVIDMWQLYKKFTREYNKNIEFRHIKSHNKDGWMNYPEDSYEYFCAQNNNYVDKLAGYARKQLTVNQDVEDTANYTDNADYANKTD